jgi:hypothetical protein
MWLFTLLGYLARQAVMLRVKHVAKTSKEFQSTDVFLFVLKLKNVQNMITGAQLNRTTKTVKRFAKSLRALKVYSVCESVLIELK